MKNALIVLFVIGFGTFASIAFIAIVAPYDEDTARGVEVLASAVGIKVKLVDDPSSRPPRVKDTLRQVESYCGSPSDSRSYETPSVLMITNSYKHSLKSGCDGTFTFANGKLYSIAR